MATTTTQSQQMSVRVLRRTSRRVAFTSWIAICLAIGLASALVQPDPWYRNLLKPQWTPPEWVFPLVWLALYVMMGMAAARITRSRHADASIALSYFIVALALNAAWQPAFFRSGALAIPLVASVTLWLAGAATFYLFRQIDRRAGALFAPALAWATFVLVLAVELWRLN
jgi:tryptophan-rich sensory protein